MESDEKEGASSVHGAPRGSPSGEGKAGAAVVASLKDGEGCWSRRETVMTFSKGEASSSPLSSSIGVKTALNLGKPARQVADESPVTKSRCS